MLMSYTAGTLAMAPAPVAPDTGTAGGNLSELGFLTLRLRL